MQGLCVYGIIARHEIERLPVFMHGIGKFERYHIIDAIYPKLRKVPWENKLIESGMSRINRRLGQGELGCLLSHRKAWKSFLNSKDATALILESDSIIPDVGKVQRVIKQHREEFDIIFL